MGQTPWSAVINLSNSIIGVSVLAMPWCFKECGVVLAISLLFVTGIVNKFSCNLLLRSSKATRKTSYETLSHHTLGGMGKLAVEVSVILLLMCTCIAFFVIIGDLGPSLLSKFLGFENTSNLRTSILVGTAVFIILPLAQKRNVESLSALSTISICFYFFFATSVFVDSLPSLLAGEWISNVVFFRPAGLLKGMSIFALSMCCQPTLFAIYNSLQERTPKMMEDVVSKGVNLVAFVYMCIGFFGYITYYQEGIKGDVLLNQPPSMISDGLKLCFALSVALSFPLVVFPCRSSIFSLLFPNADSNVITGATYIPPTMFRIITVVILAITLTVAILIPNVEVVLSITGGTMGSLACFILPALIYQHTVGVPVRFMPKVLLIIGISFMLFSTYDNIRPAPQDNHIPAPAAHVFDKLDQVKKLDEFPIDKVIEKPNIAVDKSAEKMGLQGEDVLKDKDTEFNVGDIMAVEKVGKDTGEEQLKDKGEEEKRQEPPIPHAPVDVPDSKDKVAEDIAKVGEEKEEVQLEIPEKKEGGEEVEEPPKEKKHKKHKEEKEEIVDAAAAKKESKEIAEETEEKFKVQEEKQEIQEKKLEELQARQVIQERLIVKQAEEIDQLKKEHEEDKQMDENLQNAAAQLAQVQVAQAQVAQAQAAQAQVAQQGMGQAVLPAQGQLPQQPVAGGLQQPAGPGIAVQPAAGQPVAGQPVAGQPVAGQPMAGLVGDPQGLGQLGVQQQPLPGQVPVGQLPMGQPVGQLPVAQAQAQVPIGQAAGQIPVAQGQGQLPLGQAAGQPVQLQAGGQLPIGQQPLEGQPQFQGQLMQQQPLAAGQLQDVQVGMQAGAAGGGMGQNVVLQQGGGPQHAGLEGINQGAGMGGVIPQQKQQPLVGMAQQQQQQQGVLLDGAGMQAGGGGGALGQANIQQQQFQANVAQQVPLNLQQQQQQQQLLQQQQQQQQQLLLQQQQVPVQQNQQPVLEILPDVGDGGAAVGQQQAQQQGQQQGIVVAGNGMANAGFADRNQAPNGAVVEGGIPQHHEPADKMIKAVDVDAILEPGKDLNLAGGVQQRVLNQAENEGNKESEKQMKDEKEGAKNGESDGVVVQVVDEEEDGEEGMGGGNGDVVPALEEEEVRALVVGKKTGDNEDVRIENEGGADDADRGHDDDTKRIGEKKEEEEEIRDKSKNAPVDEEEDPVQAGEEKLLENHLKMIENKEEEEEEEFADQEDVGDDAVAIVRDAEEEGKIEMNQEQEDVPQKAKKDIRSREEV